MKIIENCNAARGDAAQTREEVQGDQQQCAKCENKMKTTSKVRESKKAKKEGGKGSDAMRQQALRAGEEVRVNREGERGGMRWGARERNEVTVCQECERIACLS